MYEIAENTYPLSPRERLVVLGAEKCTDQELLAILLRTGTREQSALAVSTAAFKKFQTIENFRRSTITELSQIKGIGKTKAIEIRAMIELGRRIQTSERQRYGQVMSSEEFGGSLVDEMQNFDQEHLVAIYLDAQNRIIEKKTVFIGAVNRSIANPREILHYAVKQMAVGLIVAHNHPSGKTAPSDHDRIFTAQIAEACDCLGIHFLDHVIVGKKEYFSFREAALLDDD
ncbi:MULTISPECIES: DNA repair protein RadC [unclassified Lactococcus]|uniref:RadC family protein n=1 Tax=unclassified Lactococcus TaxID=2643510 RepID=UPI0011C91845|nr:MULTISPECIES: DNA repair protein RadC [unclassified Lactococcus]MQW23147.1 DNA repair protein RadC [Lactococcus sp. dk101]TXK44199.1 JAB domain-containing protein [Lactococcus sp. dk310]TXK49930.1 JAB domain-containing protein [Lactococcus sp. dk322]